MAAIVGTLPQYIPSMNPIGSDSAVALGLTVAVALLVSPLSMIPQRWRAYVCAGASISFFFGAMYKIAQHYFGWDAQQWVATITLAAFSFVLAWDCRRFRGRQFMIMCCVVT